MKNHGERAHSKFSASGSERWFNCPGSVELSEGVRQKDSIWSIEGTKAHEVLEEMMLAAIELEGYRITNPRAAPDVPAEMVRHGMDAANFILDIHRKNPDSELLVETRIYLPFIHPEMFGTFDGAVVDYFGTLHVFDYKYGAGVPVSPVKNLQMIFYGIGLADRYHWNFKRVRLWIIQPRIKGFDGPIYWELPMLELKEYVGQFRRAVRRVIKNPQDYLEGDWCHWCSAKGRCPLKNEKRLEKATRAFSALPDLRDEINFGKKK